MLSREAILAADCERKTKVVKVPAWGGEVIVRELNAEEYDDYEATLFREGVKGAENARARLAVRCIVDETGVRLFSDADAALLGKKSAAAIRKVADVAQRLNKLTDADMEDLKGNS